MGLQKDCRESTAAGMIAQEAGADRTRPAPRPGASIPSGNSQQSGVSLSPEATRAPGPCAMQGAPVLDRNGISPAPASSLPLDPAGSAIAG